MSPPRQKQTDLDSFLVSWRNEAHARYEAEYGGQRAGTRKGDPIGFPRRKIHAAFVLMFYRGPERGTLRDVAKAAEVSEGLLRVWRTETPFRELSRRLVWDFADAFVHHLTSKAMIFPFLGTN